MSSKQNVSSFQKWNQDEKSFDKKVKKIFQKQKKTKKVKYSDEEIENQFTSDEEEKNDIDNLVCQENGNNSNTEPVDSSSDCNPSSPLSLNTKKNFEEESEYEKLRRIQIEENMKFFQKLGLSKVISKLPILVNSKKRKSIKTEKKLIALRRSSRQKINSSPVKLNFEEIDKELSLADKKIGKRGKFNKKTGIWGGRIYDSVNGTTCHQCRQKTMDEKSNCCKAEENQLSKHRYCRSCLKNRYNLDLDEVLKNTVWICPLCRHTCNCSHCRKKR